MSPAQDYAEPVRQISDALDALIRRTSQEQRALACGYRCHSQISRVEDRVVRGEVESYLIAYGPARVALLQRAFPDFASAYVAAVAPTVVEARPEQSSANLVEIATTCSRSIETIVQRLPDGLSVIELREIDEQLHALAEVLHRTRLNIGRKIRGPRLSESA